MEEKKEYTQKTELKEVTVNQVEVEDMFLIVNKDGKYLIALTNKIVSKEQFNTLEEAKKYIASKPWELILNTAAVMAQFVNKPEDIKL